MEELQIGCEEVRRELSNYLEDDVTPELRSRIESHVSGCRGCRAVYDGLKNVVRLVGEGGVIELPAGFSQRLFAMIRSRTNY